MKNLLILIFALSCTYSFGCSCATPATREEITRMINNADIVVEGTPLSVIDKNKALRDRENLKKEGTNILFSVTSVIKGDLNQKVIALNQWGLGNCTELYKMGNRYFIFGYEVKGFCSKKKEYDSKIKSNNTPPPPPGEKIDKNGILTTLYYDKEETDKWEKILKSYRVFTTSSCSTFRPDSEFAKTVKKQQLSIE